MTIISPQLSNVNSYLQRPWTVKWANNLQKDELFAHLRFKILNEGYRGYPPFNYFPEMFDEVPLEKFMLDEENRIAFFIGSQFGVSPDVHIIPGLVRPGIRLAVLGKSLLSGCVAGLTILKANQSANNSFTKSNMINYDMFDKIAHFKNE